MKFIKLKSTPMPLRPYALAATTLLVAMAAAATLSAHMAFLKSTPDKDATLSESPGQVQVWFTQDPEPSVSQLTLEGPSGEVALGETKVGDEKSLVATVPATLALGNYTVKWRSAGDDGHVLRGDIAFSVRAE
jgi:methionine-rich copper-binding protein CopC